MKRLTTFIRCFVLILALPLILVENSSAETNSASRLIGSRFDKNEGQYRELISDSLFLHSPSALTFDIQTFLNEQPGPLKDYVEQLDGQSWNAAEAIRFNAIFYGINPQLILVLLEGHNRVLTDAAAKVPKRADPNPTKGASFFHQARWIAQSLLMSHDKRRYYVMDDKVSLPTGETLEVPRDMNAGTYAVQATLAQILPRNEWTQWVQGTEPRFIQQFSQWFGDPRQNPDNFETVSSALPSGYILPFTVGETWYYTGGPHHNLGVNHCAPGTLRANCPPGPWSAIDIAPPEMISCPSGNYPANRWVVAAQDGTVVTLILPKIRPMSSFGDRPNFGQKTAYGLSSRNKRCKQACISTA